MNARIAARVQVCLQEFWRRQRARAAKRHERQIYYNKLRLPIWAAKASRRFPNQLAVPPTFETPRTHHTHTEIKEARHAQ